MTFTFTMIQRYVTDRPTETVEGAITAENRDAAIRELRAMAREQGFRTPKIDIFDETGAQVAQVLVHGNGTMGIARY